VEAFLLLTKNENGIVREGLVGDHCQRTEGFVIGEIHLAVPELWLGIWSVAIP
jgi:hypothetical protein